MPVFAGKPALLPHLTHGNWDAAATSILENRDIWLKTLIISLQGKNLK